MKITNQFDRRDDSAKHAASQQSAFAAPDPAPNAPALNSGTAAQKSCIVTGILRTNQNHMRFLHSSHSAAHLPEA
nr:hypothetical protein [Marinicella sp. W31]MDC2875975.1 hypothetical protein [Marinicella sp. W31]